MSAEPTRAYYVERVSRTVTTYLVYADTAHQAEDLVARGEAEAIDSVTTAGRSARARREPSEDRDL